MTVKKSNKVETALTLAGNLNDVPSILDQIDKALAEQTKLVETPFITTGNLDDFGDITKETSIQNLIAAAASVIARDNAYNEARTVLQVGSTLQYTISGGTREQWLQDIKLRINIVQQKETLDKLTEFKDKMKKFLSEEDQKSMLLKEMLEFAKTLPNSNLEELTNY